MEIMTKSAFILECIDDVFSVSVAGNFTIENYKNINNLDFYKTLFDNYVILSNYYDKIKANTEMCEDEFDAKLLTAINISKEENLRLYLSSLSEVVREHNIDYNVEEEYNKLARKRECKGKISDLFGKMLIDIREKEEI